ncbi:hypothetical protein [Acinetobacter bereziniae]|uniref:hypothetical protein n=1 Tax=Acinetobacter bereziniae TaxID=106648 RepID=UPI003AF5A26B
MKKLIYPLVISVIFAGCTTTKISPEIRNQLNQTQMKLQAQPVAILVNSCLLTNELGKDLILNQPTQLTSEKFIQTFSKQLNQNGVQISEIASPFICGSMPEEQLKKYDILINKDLKRAEITNYPFLNTTNSNMNVDQQKAVLAFNQYIAKSNEVILANSRNKKLALSLPILEPETINTLKDWSKSNYIFVVSLDGLKASAGSKLAMGALSVGVTLATMGAGAGLVTTYIPKQGQFYSVRLFDLGKQEFVWNKYSTLDGNIFSTKNHTIEAHTILDPLFENKQE